MKKSTALLKVTLPHEYLPSSLTLGIGIFETNVDFRVILLPIAQLCHKLCTSAKLSYNAKAGSFHRDSHMTDDDS